MEAIRRRLGCDHPGSCYPSDSMTANRMCCSHPRVAADDVADYAALPAR